EKPLAGTLAEALDLAHRARQRGVKHGVVQDKLFLPGIRKLKRLVDRGFFGRILSVRGEFGYWGFEGEDPPAQRPSWNYRTEDGGAGRAVAGLKICKIQRRDATPRAVWNPDVPGAVDYYAQWQEVPDEERLDNAFKVEWEMFLRHVAADEPFAHDFREGAKGVQLAELALASWRERRWVDVPDLAGCGATPAGGDGA